MPHLLRVGSRRPTTGVVTLVVVLLAGMLAGCASPSDPADPADPTGLAQAGAPLPEAPGCPLLPADSYWYADVRDLPVHASSAAWVDAVGTTATMHPDFGSGTFDGGPIGIPYTVVDASTPLVPVAFTYAEESDPGPYPIPDDALVECGPDADGDRHVLLVDADACVLHELFDARPDGAGGWTAGSGARFPLDSHAMRPADHTSADAAGLPILPGLVRYDEVAAGVVGHAIRITAPRTDRQWIWPARHQAGAADDPSLPPMGAWFRLSAAIDPADFPAQARPIVVALQTHGAILADHGSSWFISGVPDPRWDDDALRSLRDIPGSAFEVVDTSSLVQDPDSGQVAGAGPDPTPSATASEVGLRDGGRLAGPSRIDTAVAISQAQFPDGAPTAYLARADETVDAVAGGVLTDGPILLVPSCGTLPSVVATEIARLDPDRVVALGGEGAVCEDLLRQARAA